MNEFFSSIEQIVHGLNILDYLIILVFIIYALEGYSLGFLASSIDLVSFLASFVLALKLYGYIGTIIMGLLTIPHSFANAIGFFVSALLSEICLNIILRYFSLRFFSSGQNRLKNLNQVLGVIPGILSALILLSFIISLIISLPISPVLKRTISSSPIGSRLVFQTQGFEKKLNDIFGQAALESLNFFTVHPQSDQFVNLNFKTTSAVVDQNAEQTMYRLVNQERRSRGLTFLEFDNRLRDVARKHSSDMLERGYFSHYTPEGLSPFDRMSEAGIDFTVAGENLALAPSTELAMQGLMNSPGHRQNILSKDFGKIGIGVIDGGIYGEMFSQEFTN